MLGRRSKSKIKKVTRIESGTVTLAKKDIVVKNVKFEGDLELCSQQSITVQNISTTGGLTLNSGISTLSEAKQINSLAYAIGVNILIPTFLKRTLAQRN